MQKHSKGADAYPAMDRLIPRAVNNSGPDDDAGDSKLFAILRDYFLLFEFCEAISLSPKLGPRFHRTRFIQHPPARLFRIGINRKRTDINEPPQAFVLDTCF